MTEGTLHTDIDVRGWYSCLGLDNLLERHQFRTEPLLQLIQVLSTRENVPLYNYIYRVRSLLLRTVLWLYHEYFDE